MCGIIAYIGDRLCRKIVLDGLARLEYRGYDSAGFACIDSNHKHLNFAKEAGGLAPVQRLADSIKFDGYIGIAHTRWATHGVVDQNNAHPQFNCKKSIAVVHNGIVEGYEALRHELAGRGHVFSSATDTEVVAHLLSELLTQNTDIKSAIVQFAKTVNGAFAFLFLLEQYPDTLIVIRRRNPMVIGVGKEEMFVASDFMAFADKTSQAVFMPDDSFALVSKNSVEIYNFNGDPVPYLIQEINPVDFSVDKEGFEHYMLKEIYEQKRAINRTITFCKVIGSYTNDSLHENFDLPLSQNNLTEHNNAIWRQIGLTKEHIKNLSYINLISAGTSWHASRIAQFFFESICNIPTRIYLASEFRYMPFFPEPNSIYLMVSQSGETADTLEALRLINSFEQHTIAITNVASSSMVREASGFLPMQAGPEISVASTKAFSTQVATLYWLANRMALDRGNINAIQMHEAEENIFVAAEVLEATIEIYKLKITQELAPFYAQFDRFIFLGRHVSYPFALEAALKLKEVSYIFAQCYPAGELKHGPIALIDEKTPVILFSVLDELIYRKTVSNANEIKARKGHLIVFAFEGQHELIKLADFAFILPRVTPLLAPLAMVGIMQFFVYQISRQLGNPIDKPRNLAKSVTVE